MGAPRAKALCLSFGGALSFQAGHWEQSEEELRNAVDLYQKVGSASGEALSLQRLGVLLTARGRLEEGQEALGQGLIVAERAAMRSHCLTRIQASLIRNRLAAQDEDGIKVSVAEGQAAARRHGHCVTCNALLLPELIRAEIFRNNVKEAEQHADRLEETAAEFGSRAWTAMAHQARGRVLLAKKSYQPAKEQFEQARIAFGEIDQPYEAARCLMLEARALASQRSKAAKGEAESLRAQAKSEFDRLHAAGVED